MKTIKEKSGLKTPRESIGNSGKQKMNYNIKKELLSDLQVMYRSSQLILAVTIPS